MTVQKEDWQKGGRQVYNENTGLQLDLAAETMARPFSSPVLRLWPRPLALAIAVAVGCSSNEPSPDQTNSHVPPPSTNVRVSQDRLEAEATLSDASSGTIRIATYNINWGNARLDAVVNAIRQADADVACLQETNAQSAFILRREFTDDYGHIGFYGSIDRYAAGGFAVLSKLPVVSEKFLPPKHGLFGACLLEVQKGRQLTQLIVVHLQPVVFRKGKSLASHLSVLTAFQAAEETHRREIATIMEHVRTDIPVLIVGDFNSCSMFHAPTHLVNHGFVDGFAAVNENPESHPTWHWPTKYGNVALRIDFIFHTPSHRTIASRVIRTQGSDHYLLLSELETIAADLDLSQNEETGRAAAPEVLSPPALRGRELERGGF